MQTPPRAMRFLCSNFLIPFLFAFLLLSPANATQEFEQLIQARSKQALIVSFGALDQQSISVILPGTSQEARRPLRKNFNLAGLSVSAFRSFDPKTILSDLRQPGTVLVIQGKDLANPALEGVRASGHRFFVFDERSSVERTALSRKDGAHLTRNGTPRIIGDSAKIILITVGDPSRGLTTLFHPQDTPQSKAREILRRFGISASAFEPFGSGTLSKLADPRTALLLADIVFANPANDRLLSSIKGVSIFTLDSKIGLTDVTPSEIAIEPHLSSGVSEKQNAAPKVTAVPSAIAGNNSPKPMNQVSAEKDAEVKYVPGSFSNSPGFMKDNIGLEVLDAGNNRLVFGKVGFDSPFFFSERNGRKDYRNLAGSDITGREIKRVTLFKLEDNLSKKVNVCDNISCIERQVQAFLSKPNEFSLGFYSPPYHSFFLRGEHFEDAILPPTRMVELNRQNAMAIAYRDELQLIAEAYGIAFDFTKGDSTVRIKSVAPDSLASVSGLVSEKWIAFVNRGSGSGHIIEELANTAKNDKEANLIVNDSGRVRDSLTDSQIRLIRPSSFRPAGVEIPSNVFAENGRSAAWQTLWTGSPAEDRFQYRAYLIVNYAIALSASWVRSTYVDPSSTIEDCFGNSSPSVFAVEQAATYGNRFHTSDPVVVNKWQIAVSPGLAPVVNSHYDIVAKNTPLQKDIEWLVSTYGCRSAEFRHINRIIHQIAR